MVRVILLMFMLGKARSGTPSNTIKGESAMPALGDNNFATRQYRDYSGEVRTIRLNGQIITAVLLPDYLDDLADVEAALDAVTLGVAAKSSFGNESILSNARASTKDAQVETEMLVRMRGATSQEPWSFRIPTVDYTKFNYLDDQVIISGAGASAETTALVNALQAFDRNPNDNTELGVVVGMEVVE